MKLLWEYGPSRGDSQVLWNGHEMEFISNMGKLILEYPSEKKMIFRAEKITFKFPAEHKLDNIEIEKAMFDTAELEIHHHDD